jgi:hypothetical protein
MPLNSMDNFVKGGKNARTRISQSAFDNMLRKLLKTSMAVYELFLAVTIIICSPYM